VNRIPDRHALTEFREGRGDGLHGVDNGVYPDRGVHSSHVGVSIGRHRNRLWSLQSRTGGGRGIGIRRKSIICGVRKERSD